MNILSDQAKIEQLSALASAQPYPLLFATISGAHLYGFPSPDSDYDLRGVHVLPLHEVVRLKPAREIETITVSNEVAGLEMDLVTHDIRKFFTPYIDELVQRKVSGPEKSTLDNTDIDLYEREYQRLVAELEQAYMESKLQDAPTCYDTLDAFLVRIRMRDQQ